MKNIVTRVTEGNKVTLANGTNLIIPGSQTNNPDLLLKVEYFCSTNGCESLALLGMLGNEIDFQKRDKIMKKVFTKWLTKGIFAMEQLITKLYSWKKICCLC